MDSDTVPVEAGSLVGMVSQTVVLVGLMGAGKTSVGRRLAARLELDFVDADAEIEAAVGCSIEDIFAMHGESTFRDGERRVLARLLREPVRVIATGGGAYIDPGTRRVITESGIAVWLRANLETLVQRTARRGDRPLLKQQRPREVLARLIDERYPIYEEAPIIIDADEGSVDSTVERVVQALVSYASVGTDDT